jgi:hypothetical protein
MSEQPTNDRLSQDIIELHEAGMSREQIAAELQVSLRTVKMTIGVDKDAVVQAYQDPKQEPVSSIAYRFGLYVPEVYAILDERNIQRRSSGNMGPNFDRRRVSKFQLDMAVEMYVDGQLLSWIKNETGISQPTLHHELRKRGIPLRGKGKRA